MTLQRLVRSQILFREVNEQVCEVVNPVAFPLEFLCECSDQECTETMALDLAEYDRIRSHANLFLVALGHERPAVDRVIDQGEGYTSSRRRWAWKAWSQPIRVRRRRSAMGREERMLENQETFRYANERLRELVVRAGTTDHRHIAFLCECADRACHGRLNATVDEFEDAHLTSQHYFILPATSPWTPRRRSSRTDATRL